LDQESDNLIQFVTNLEEVNQDLLVNLLKRIVLLENINGQLVTCLKSHIGRLKQFEATIPNPEKWRGMVGSLESKLQTAETVQKQKMFKQTDGFIGTP
jgi:hypothetical protein